MNSARRFAFSLLALALLGGCATSPQNAGSGSDREVSNTRVATVPELGDQEVTVRSGPRTSR